MLGTARTHTVDILNNEVPNESGKKLRRRRLADGCADADCEKENAPPRAARTSRSMSGFCTTGRISGCVFVPYWPPLAVRI